VNYDSIAYPCRYGDTIVCPTWKGKSELSGPTKKFGKFPNVNRIVQRYRCTRCGKTFSEEQLLNGVRIEKSKAIQIAHLLCEGVGIRAAARLADVDQSARLFNRRFTRLSLGYSKTIANHRHALALFAAHYNFCRIHSAHGKDKKTPAQAANLTDHAWTDRN